MHREPAFSTSSLPPRPHLRPGHDTELAAVALPAPALLTQVTPRVRPARRPSEAATARVRAHGASGIPGRTGRRRLRREVKMAAYVLLATLSLATALVLLSTIPAVSGSVHEARSPIAAEIRPPVVSITLDPGALSPPAEPEAPVVLPGYLLPDEGAEEPADAGG